MNLAKLSTKRLILLWRQRSAPAGALDQVSIEMRRLLVARGHWAVIYAERSDGPCERCAESDIGSAIGTDGSGSETP